MLEARKLFLVWLLSFQLEAKIKLWGKGEKEIQFFIKITSRCDRRIHNHSLSQELERVSNQSRSLFDISKALI